MKFQFVAISTLTLAVLFGSSISLAGSSRRTLDSGTVILTCNNNSGRSEAQFQLISSVGIIGVLDFYLKFNNGENIQITTPTQVRKSITGFRDARGKASRVTIVGSAYGFDNHSNPYKYIIPPLSAVCDHKF